MGWETIIALHEEPGCHTEPGSPNRTKHKESKMIECQATHLMSSSRAPGVFSTTGNTLIREGTMFDPSAGGCAVTSTTP